MSIRKLLNDRGEWDNSCGTNVFGKCFYTDYQNLPPHLSLPAVNTLAHSHAINRKTREGKLVPCTRSRLTDKVKCYYLFGETILETTHKVGECPWKLMWTPGLKSAVVKWRVI